MKTDKVIRIETEALEQLACRLVEIVQEKYAIPNEQWISEKEAMSIIGISSKTTIGKLRAEGKIAYSQPYKRVIVYDKKSIYQFLSKHIKNTF
jgi:hypothetical protein